MPTVILLEEDQKSRRMLQRFLRSQSLEVRPAASVPEALAALRAVRADCLLVGAGPGALRQLRAAGAEMPALALLEEDTLTERRRWFAAGADAWLGESSLLDGVPETEFLGYESMACRARVLAIVKDGQRVESATAGDEAVLVFDRTVFYGESGGQVGDTGSGESADAMFTVTNTTKNHAKNYLHQITVSAGSVSVGEEVSLQVDEERRLAIMRNTRRPTCCRRRCARCWATMWSRPASW